MQFNCCKIRHADIALSVGASGADCQISKTQMNSAGLTQQAIYRGAPMVGYAAPD